MSGFRGRQEFYASGGSCRRGRAAGAGASLPPPVRRTGTARNGRKHVAFSLSLHEICRVSAEHRLSSSEYQQRQTGGPFPHDISQRHGRKKIMETLRDPRGETRRPAWLLSPRQDTATSPTRCIQDERSGPRMRSLIRFSRKSAAKPLVLRKVQDFVMPKSSLVCSAIGTPVRRLQASNTKPTTRCFRDQGSETQSYQSSVRGLILRSGFSGQDALLRLDPERCPWDMWLAVFQKNLGQGEICGLHVKGLLTQCGARCLDFKSRILCMSRHRRSGSQSVVCCRRIYLLSRCSGYARAPSPASATKTSGCGSQSNTLLTVCYVG